LNVTNRRAGSRVASPAAFGLAGEAARNSLAVANRFGFGVARKQAVMPGTMEALGQNVQ
jgi:hypothetical protein